MIQFVVIGLFCSLIGQMTQSVVIGLLCSALIGQMAQSVMIGLPCSDWSDGPVCHDWSTVL